RIACADQRAPAAGACETGGADRCNAGERPVGATRLDGRGRAAARRTVADAGDAGGLVRDTGDHGEGAQLPEVIERLNASPFAVDLRGEFLVVSPLPVGMPRAIVAAPAEHELEILRQLVFEELNER